MHNVRMSAIAADYSHSDFCIYEGYIVTLEVEIHKHGGNFRFFSLKTLLIFKLYLLYVHGIKSVPVNSSPSELVPKG